MGVQAWPAVKNAIGVPFIDTGERDVHEVRLTTLPATATALGDAGDAGPRTLRVVILVVDLETTCPAAALTIAQRGGHDAHRPAGGR